jgi:hypothetical protein
MDLTKICTGIPYGAFVSTPLPVSSSYCFCFFSSAPLTLEDVSAVVTTTIKGFLPSLDDSMK